MEEGRRVLMEMHLHSVLTVVMLFFLGLISPGPNFMVVAETTLTFGRVPGFVTALGASLGDAVYASLGLFGVTRFIALDSTMKGIQLLGGLYLAWLGIRMIFHGTVVTERRGSSAERVSRRSHFWRGLATDLANPKTVVFFASIFAVTVRPDNPLTVRGAMLAGIVLTSVVWRFFLSIVFSTTLIRRAYERTEPVVERVFGAGLCLFGVLFLRRAMGNGVS